jgi:hypothetical protein
MAANCFVRKCGNQINKIAPHALNVFIYFFHFSLFFILIVCCLISRTDVAISLRANLLELDTASLLLLLLPLLESITIISVNVNLDKFLLSLFFSAQLAQFLLSHFILFYAQPYSNVEVVKGV